MTAESDALTAINLSTLPRFSVAAEPSASREPISRSTAASGLEGEGFPVRRAFAGIDLRLLDPFVLLDQMGRVDYGPYEPRGTDWHPHRGFETVTYILDGTIQHQDSHGGGGTISSGDTQWMTAGSGILHIETPPEELVVSGGVFHGIQLWVNLPAAKKMSPPRYQSLEVAVQQWIASADGASVARIIAGDVGGYSGPGDTHTPITLIHATVNPGSQIVVPHEPSFNALVYALSGEVSVGLNAVAVRAGQLAVLDGGTQVVLANPTSDGGEPAEVLLLGGAPIREPVAWEGPFVMNTRAELRQAFDDYQLGRLGTIPPDGLKSVLARQRTRG